MFDRAVQSAFICLRCQSRLLSRQSTCSSSIGLRRLNSVARWQSTAVARVEEEDDDNEGHSHEDRGDNDNKGLSEENEELDIRQTSSDILRLMPKEMSNGTKQRTDHYQGAYRKFHPDSVAELGVSSLGKPAEVLVLQHRDRFIPKAPTDEDAQNEPQLLEALQAETAPLDPEQVKHNIEQIKKPFGDDGHVLDEAQWKELRYNLVKGFTHVQLLEYIRHMEEKMGHTSKQAVESADAPSSTPFSSELSRIVRERPELKRAGRNKIKKRAAISIITDIWGFSLPAGEDEAEQMQSATVSMARYHIGALKAQQSQSFKKLSESFKVKIDVFQDKSKIVINGSTDAVEEARKALISMRSQITSMKIYLEKGKHLLPGLSEGKYEQRLLEEVGRNRPVYVEKKNLNKGAPSVRIFYHHSARQEAEAVRRDIILAGRRIGPPSSISIWPRLKQQSTWLVPYTSWQALPWWERLGDWGRWNFSQEADAKATKSSPTHDASTSTLANQVYEWLCRSNLKPNSSSKSGSMTQQYMALFGQALFLRDVKQQLHSVLKAQHMRLPNPQPSSLPHANHALYSSSPRIVTDIPLLAQSLASCKPWSVISKGSIDSKKHSCSTGHFMHRLLLLPATKETYLPSLQVYLKGDKSNLGLRQPLRIHSISAILEERSHVVLLPDRAVDVEFRRQTLYHLYVANWKTNPKHDQFKNQFLHYLNQAQGQEVPGFAPFVKLSLPAEFGHLFKPLDSAPASGLEDIEAPSGNADSSSTTPTVPSKSTRRAGATEYVLAASETVEAASFSHTIAKGLCLDHIDFSALDETQGRQELRLAQRPYPDTQATSVQFSKLFDSAYGLASWLGDPTLLKEQA